MSDFIKRRYSDEVVDTQIVTSAGGSLAAELSSLDGVTATAAEINRLAAVTPGTLAASKYVAVGSDSKINTWDMTAMKIGGTSVTASATELNKLASCTATTAELNKLASCTATTAELNLVDNKIASFTFTPAAGASTIAEIAITAKDAAGATIAAPWIGVIWLSDTVTTGLGLTSTTASGTVQAKAASGTDFAALTAKKALMVQSLASGVYTLEITDAAKTLFYIGAISVGGLGSSVSAQLIAGNYGA